MTRLPTTDLILKQYNRDSVFTQIRLNSCLVDSGTTDCLVSSSCFLNAHFSYDQLGHKLYISNALNQKSEKVIRKMFHCNVMLPEFSLELVNCGFFVVEGDLAFPAILGMSVLNRLIIDLRDSNFKISVCSSNRLLLRSACDFVVQSNNAKVGTPHVLATSEAESKLGTELFLTTTTETERTISSVTHLNFTTPKMTVSRKAHLWLESIGKWKYIVPSGARGSPVKDFKGV